MFFTPYGFTTTRNPFRDLERLVDNLSVSFQRSVPGATRSDNVPLTVWANDLGLTITAELPGVDPAKVTVDVLGDSVTISGKRARGDAGEVSFTRTVRLPYPVDADHCEARSADGVLTITLQRPAAERPRSIAVKTA